MLCFYLAKNYEVCNFIISHPFDVLLHRIYVILLLLACFLRLKRFSPDLNYCTDSCQLMSLILFALLWLQIRLMKKKIRLMHFSSLAIYSSLLNGLNVAAHFPPSALICF